MGAQKRALKFSKNHVELAQGSKNDAGGRKTNQSSQSERSGHRSGESRAYPTGHQAELKPLPSPPPRRRSGGGSRGIPKRHGGAGYKRWIPNGGVNSEIINVPEARINASVKPMGETLSTDQATCEIQAETGYEVIIQTGRN